MLSPETSGYVSRERLAPGVNRVREGYGQIEVVPPITAEQLTVAAGNVRALLRRREIQGLDLVRVEIEEGNLEQRIEKPDGSGTELATIVTFAGRIGTNGEARFRQAFDGMVELLGGQIGQPALHDPHYPNGSYDPIPKNVVQAQLTR